MKRLLFRDVPTNGMLWGAALLLNISICAQTLLICDGRTSPYSQVSLTLGTAAETPDCAHPDFGPHITQTADSDLGKSVFAFNIHATPDNDRCLALDRQRLEIKIDSTSPASLKGFLNESVTFRWRFKLPSGFQPSNSFTHIHQIKAGDGDSDAPIIVLSPSKAIPNQMRLSHSTGTGGISETVAVAPLSPFIGVWVEAYEKITYSHSGKYSLVLRRLSNGTVLFSYSNNNIDLWRAGTTFSRPKWGIYRSLNDIGNLRDEQVRFDSFCLAKGNDDCPEQSANYAVLSAASGTTAVSAESIASFYGSSLAIGIAAATDLPLPTVLGGVSVRVTDRAGVARTARLFYVSPRQINFETPSGMAIGPGTAAVLSGSHTVALAPASVVSVAPGLFAADGSGKGVAAAIAVRLAADGQPSMEPIFQCSNGSCGSVPIDLSVDTPVYLSLYGTGIRSRSSLASVGVTINGTAVPVLYAGPQVSFDGLDQVNIAVPLSLRGSGETDLVLSADGQVANAVRVNIR